MDRPDTGIPIEAGPMATMTAIRLAAVPDPARIKNWTPMGW